MKKQLSFSLAVCIVAFFTGCKKDSNIPAAGSQINNAVTNNKVITPFGVMDAAHVHFVGEGNSLSVIEGRLKKVDAAGKITEDFGPVHRLDDNLNLAKNAILNKNIYPAASGWIAYAYWAYTDTASKHIKYFTTNWIVPSEPASKSSQTLFLFNGMQDGLTASSYIIQPVLQWGSSAAGGGKYWSVTNWYVSSSDAFYGTLVKVTPGTALQGIMQQTAHSGSSYSYNSSFAGYPAASNLQVNNVPQAWWCAETLETYGVTNVSTQYPPDNFVAMNAIQILKGTTNAPVNWKTAKASGSVPQKAVVVTNGSPNGEVDIYFR